MADMQSSPGSESADPLAGLVERLDRLCLTSTEDGRRFVLATESARNIVEIVRVWIGARAPAQRGQQWLPIETAPKNGEPIILYVPINTPDRRILSGYWTDAGWWICSGSIVLGKPTHWMMLQGPYTSTDGQTR